MTLPEVCTRAPRQVAGVFNLELNQMSEWEYRKIDLNDPPREKSDLDLLDNAGDEGWELITITVNSIAYLKRPITKPRPNRKS